MKRLGIAISFATLLGAVATGPSEPPESPTPKGEAPSAAPREDTAEHLFSQWHSIYLAGRKVGYRTMSVWRLADGGHRIEVNLFLKNHLSADQPRYFQMIEAETDAAAQPRMLDATVASDMRSWHVTGRRTEDHKFLLQRTVEGQETTAEIPLQAGITLRSWALWATFFGHTAPGAGVGGGKEPSADAALAGQTDRWLLIDESLGALLPDPCTVRVLGPQTLVAGPQRTMSGTVVLWTCGHETVAHLMDPQGRTLRSVWQSTPLVAEATSLGEARKMDGAPDGPPGISISGLEGDRYHNPQMGYTLHVPPYPFVAHVAAEANTVWVGDLTDEASVTVRPAMDPRLATMHTDEAELIQLADLVHRQWAARFDSCEAEPVRETDLNGRPARLIEGTARLGCTTFHFRNVFLVGEGFAYLVTATVADRPLKAKPVLLDPILASLRLAPPEGQLPIRTSGDRLRIPYYGLEICRPNERWKIPRHLDGPVTVLELARDDQSGVIIVRVFSPNREQPLTDFEADRAQQAAERFHIEPPQPQTTTLGGRHALELAYEGNLLAGQPAECRAIYTPVDSQILALILIGQKGAEETRKELDSLRQSVRFTESESSGQEEKESP